MKYRGLERRIQAMEEFIPATRRILEAHYQFRDEVGGLMLSLVAKGDPAGMVLLEMVKDLEARTGEFVMNGEDE